MSEEDWQLAGVVMSVSDQTTEHTLGALEQERQRDATARAREEGHVELVRSDVVEEGERDRVKASVLAKLERERGRRTTRKELRNTLKPALRGHLDHALGVLEGAGRIEVRQEGQAIVVTLR